MKRPVDPIAASMFGRTAEEAQRDGICIRCKKGVYPDGWDYTDLLEYQISALCPDCWSAVMEWSA